MDDSGKAQLPLYNPLQIDRPGKIPSYIDIPSLHSINVKIRAAMKRQRNSRNSLNSLHKSSDSIGLHVPSNGGHNATFDLSKCSNRSTSNIFNDLKMTRKSFVSQDSGSDFSSLSSVCNLHSQQKCGAGNPKLLPCNEKSENLCPLPSFPEKKRKEINCESLSAAKYPQTPPKSSSVDGEEIFHPTCRSNSPASMYVDLLERQGLQVSFQSSLRVKGYFYRMEQKESYYDTIKDALISQDISLLRAMQEVGISLQCCNSIGEGLIHLSCRHGFTDVTTFLVEEAKVSVRVIDEGGRTPLHDACMHEEPNLDLVELLIEKEPDLLLMCDQKGLAPLDCIWKEKTGIWFDFLSTRQNILKPRYFCQKMSNTGLEGVVGNDIG